MQTRNNSNLKGVDISHYNDNIDFGKQATNTQAMTQTVLIKSAHNPIK